MTVGRLASLTYQARPLFAPALEMPFARLRPLKGQGVFIAFAQDSAAKLPEPQPSASSARGNGSEAFAGWLAPAACRAAVASHSLPAPWTDAQAFRRRHPAAVALPETRFSTSQALRPCVGLAVQGRDLTAARLSLQMLACGFALARCAVRATGQIRPAMPAVVNCTTEITATTCTTPLPGRMPVCNARRSALASDLF